MGDAWTASGPGYCMKNTSLWQRFYLYQAERFPFAVLIFTTLAVVLSSFAIALPASEHIAAHWPAILVGTLTGLLFLFSMRVADDHKDHHFDNQYHTDRPVQRGVIQLRELQWFGRAGLAMQILLNIAFSVVAFLWWLVAFAYSWLAGKEFFLGERIRTHFYLYNVLNLMQLFVMQFYLYALVSPQFSWKDELLFIHFLFVLLNAAILEFARKMKHRSQESKGKDTYSSRLGVGGAAAIYSLLFIAVYALFLYMLWQLSASTILFYVSLVPFGIILLSTLLYAAWHREQSPKIVEASAILFYLAMHVLLVFTRV